MVFPVVMYGCESWTVKKVEHQRIDDFKLWHWRTLESPLGYKNKPVNPIGNQPWILIGRTDAEAEAPILWPLNARADSLEKTLMLRKTEHRRRRGWQRMRWLDGIIDSMDLNWANSGRQGRTGKPCVLQCMRSQRVAWTTIINFTEKVEAIRRKGPSHAPTDCMCTHILCFAFTDMLHINNMCIY